MTGRLGRVLDVLDRPARWAWLPCAALTVGAAAKVAASRDGVLAGAVAGILALAVSAGISLMMPRRKTSAAQDAADATQAAHGGWQASHNGVAGRWPVAGLHIPPEPATGQPTPAGGVV